MDTPNTGAKNDTEKNSLQTNRMFVKKQAEYLSINIDQIQFLTFIFADGRAAQTSTKDIYNYSECQTWQLCPSYYWNSTEQSKQLLAAQGINQQKKKITTNTLLLHFNIRTNHDLISENVFT